MKIERDRNKEGEGDRERERNRGSACPAAAHTLKTSRLNPSAGGRDEDQQPITDTDLSCDVSSLA